MTDRFSDFATDFVIKRVTTGDVPAMADIVCSWEAEMDWVPALHVSEKIAGFIRGALPEREIWVATKAESDSVLGCLPYDLGLGRICGLYCRRREGFVEVSRHMPEPPETVEEIRMEWVA
jgi:hypothetical protein